MDFSYQQVHAHILLSTPHRKPLNQTHIRFPNNQKQQQKNETNATILTLYTNNRKIKQKTSSQFVTFTYNPNFLN